MREPQLSHSDARACCLLLFTRVRGRRLGQPFPEDYPRAGEASEHHFCARTGSHRPKGWGQRLPEEQSRALPRPRRALGPSGWSSAGLHPRTSRNQKQPALTPRGSGAAELPLLPLPWRASKHVLEGRRQTTPSWASDNLGKHFSNAKSLEKDQRSAIRRHQGDYTTRRRCGRKTDSAADGRSQPTSSKGFLSKGAKDACEGLTSAPGTGNPGNY